MGFNNIFLIIAVNQTKFLFESKVKIWQTNSKFSKF